MASLTISQIQNIKEHMIEDDAAKLKSKFKSKNTAFDIQTVDLNELDDKLSQGWECITRLTRKARIQRPKNCGRKFEDDIWCMFYNLGFTKLNYDENLEIPWGPNEGDHHQIDVLAVGEDAIFVVECKATEKSKQKSFKEDIDNMMQYKPGVTKALKQIYGEEKKVKFIFATQNYRFPDTSEDLKRLSEKKIYHFNENSYNYVKNLIKSYKTSVIYQFYGLMFKDELINNERIEVPALKGRMGKHDYYMLSIEPSKLLKIGFVLHRTKVNDSMAPTYQRLLVPNRLKGITKFIDEGGYFPNSIIINFCPGKNSKNKISFSQTKNVGDTKTKLGTLSIPNAYGIAYIIDGQHRVYGYAGSKFKDTNTIPVVAFDDMDSEEQLKIFMDINENQKAVSPSLRLDLAQDINWNSERADSRMLALRSAIIKQLGRNANSVLYTKISVGEDNAKLTFKPFDAALSKSSLLPKATYSSYVNDTDVCLYDCNNTDFDQAMKESQKLVSSFIQSCYQYVKDNTTDDVYDTYIECNRGTFAFIVLIGTLNKHSIHNGAIDQKSSITKHVDSIKPYLDVLIDYLENIPDEQKNTLLLTRGQGADSTWLHMFQLSINKVFTNYNPDGLQEWKETQDKGLQEKGRKIGENIKSILKTKIFNKLEDLYGDNWERNIFETKTKCLSRMAEIGDASTINENDWPDYIEISDLKDIISNNWLITKEGDDSYHTFEEEFSINIGNNFKSKKDKLAWITNLISMQKHWSSSASSSSLTNANISELELILESLDPSETEEN